MNFYASIGGVSLFCFAPVRIKIDKSLNRSMHQSVTAVAGGLHCFVWPTEPPRAMRPGRGEGGGGGIIPRRLPLSISIPRVRGISQSVTNAFRHCDVCHHIRCQYHFNHWPTMYSNGFLSQRAMRTSRQNRKWPTGAVVPQVRQ